MTERETIEKALIDGLQEKGLYREPYKNQAEQYMTLYDTFVKLKNDIEGRGVFFTSHTGLQKKNDSVGLIIQITKQMYCLLDKMSLSADTQGKIRVGADL